MNGRTAYLDTSAFLKLIVEAPESHALGRFLLRWPLRASATLLRTETVRALRRAGHDGELSVAHRLFRALRFIRLDEPLLDHAGALDPRRLRSLDAIHLAAALALGPDCGVVLTYDAALREAAQGKGLEVAAPR